MVGCNDSIGEGESSIQFINMHNYKKDLVLENEHEWENHN